MIKSKQDLRDYLEHDSKNYSQLFPLKVGILRYIRSFVCSPITDQTKIWAYIKTLRYAEYWMNKKGVLPFLMSVYYMSKLRRLSRITGFQIPIRCIGKGLTIWHWGTIIINEDVQIGDFCTLRPGVVIGHKREGEGSPVIGSNVEINSGARIIGEISIGDDVIIATNTVVTRDIPSHCIVAGTPAKILKTREDYNCQWERV